jgi:F420-dependent oxidoreductase-like protein
VRLGYVSPFSLPEHRRATLDYARLAEEGGYESVWVPEAWSSDAFTLLGAIASHTSRLKLATGIVNIFSRTPALLAQSFATLDELSNGRAIVGLGTSGLQVVERWHGMKFDRPLRRMREVVDIMRLAFSGKRVDYGGEFFKLSGFTMLIKPVRERMPIYLATFKPQSLRLTGEIADGWLPTHLSLAHLPAMRADLAAGEQKAARPAGSVDLAAQTLTSVSEDGDEARLHCAEHLAYYVGGMGAYYHELMHSYGFGEEADRIQERWKAKDRIGAARQVSRAMLDALVIAGTRDDCLQAIAKRRAAGIEHIVIFPPHGASVAEVKRTMTALAPAAIS